MSEPAQASPSAASVLRRGALRCALFGLLFTAGSFTIFLFVSPRGAFQLLPFGLTLALSALAAAPATALELGGKRWPTSLGRDAIVALLGAAIGPLSFVLAFFQAIFSYELAQTRSYDRAAAEVMKELGRSFDAEFLGFAFGLGVLVAPLVVGRVRGFRTLAVLGLTLGTALFVSTPLITALFQHEGPVFAAFTFATAMALPLAASLGDRAEDLVARLWSSE